MLLYRSVPDRKRLQLPLEDISSDSDGELTRPRKPPTHKRRVSVPEHFEEVKRVRLVPQDEQDYLSSLKDYSKLKGGHPGVSPTSKRPQMSDRYEHERGGHREVVRSPRDHEYLDSLRDFDKFRKSRTKSEERHRQKDPERRNFDFERPDFVRQGSSETSRYRQNSGHRRSSDYPDDSFGSCRRVEEPFRYGHEQKLRRDSWPEPERPYREHYRGDERGRFKLEEPRYDVERVRERYPSTSPSSSTSQRPQHRVQRHFDQQQVRDQGHPGDRVRFIRPESTSKHQRQPSQEEKPKKPQSLPNHKSTAEKSQSRRPTPREANGEF